MENIQSKKENKVMLIGLVLIILIVSITLIRPALKKKDSPEEEKDTQSKEVYSDYEYITSKELAQKISGREKLTIVDIRDSINFGKEHIENSINITPDKIQQEVKKLNKDELIVITGYNFDDKNSEAGAVKFFKDSGFKNVMALSGGVLAWKTNLQPTIRLGDPESVVDVSKVETLAPERLKLAIDNNYPMFIIDARKKELFSSGHIPGAVNIPFEEIEKRKNEIPASKEIVIYSDSSMGDFQASVKIYDMNFMANYIIDGGFRSWQEKGYPIEK